MSTGNKKERKREKEGGERGKEREGIQKIGDTKS